MTTPVKVHGHQYYGLGDLVCIGFDADGPVAMVWVGRELIGFKLAGSRTQGATYWLEKREQRIEVEPAPRRGSMQSLFSRIWPF